MSFLFVCLKDSRTREIAQWVKDLPPESEDQSPESKARFSCMPL